MTKNEKYKEKTKESTNSCLMGPNWMLYVVYIILGLIFILIIVWISSYWISQECNYNLEGKLLLKSFGKDCVIPAK
jgi:hypothetical protein